MHEKYQWVLPTCCAGGHQVVLRLGEMHPLNVIAGRVETRSTIVAVSCVLRSLLERFPMDRMLNQEPIFQQSRSKVSGVEFGIETLNIYKPECP